MALFIRQNEERSELQRRLAAELQEKARVRAEQDAKLPDGVEDSKYIEGMKRTTSLAWVWIVIILAVIVIFIAYMLAI